MYRRFENVRSIGWNDVVGQYAAVAETLMWIDIVEAQLRLKHTRHYEASLDDQPEPMRPMLRGAVWARNRITHEVDEVGYFLATAKSSEGFAAKWTWQSLPPRPPGRYQDPDGHAAYEMTLAGRGVVETLQSLVTCLGQAHRRMWQHYSEDHPPVSLAAT